MRKNGKNQEKELPSVSVISDSFHWLADALITETPLPSDSLLMIYGDSLLHPRRTMIEIKVYDIGWGQGMSQFFAAGC